MSPLATHRARFPWAPITLALALGGSALVPAASAQANEPPFAAAGGPYRGTAAYEIPFYGYASFDFDGDPLTYHWDFGDGSSADGPVPTHVYASTGSYTVTLAVFDGALYGYDHTLATVSDLLPARAFASGGNDNVRLGSGKSTTYVQVEPVGKSFSVWNILPLTVILRSTGTGSVDWIKAVSVTVDTDRDHNGIDELRACFSKDDLRRLFSNVPAKATVAPTIIGGLTTGDHFAASFVMTVSGTAAVQAGLVNEPAAGIAELQLATQSAGPLRVQVFDVRGRLIGTLADQAFAPASDYRFDLAAAVRASHELHSGVYFYRADTADGIRGGRFVVLH